MNGTKHRKDIDPLKQEAEVDLFAISFADMLTQLLIFFVLLYSMSSTDMAKYGDVLNAIKQFLKTPGPTGQGQDKSTEKGKEGGHRFDDVMEKFRQEQEKLRDIYQELNKLVGAEKLDNEISISLGRDQISLNVGNALLFDAGSADLHQRAEEVLGKISKIIQLSDSQILVEGHSDDSPVGRTSTYPSNWELSSARASAVVRFMKEQGIAEGKFAIMGFSQFRPLVPNDTEAHKAMNRRVTIILKTQIQDWEHAATEHIKLKEELGDPHFKLH